MKSLLKEFKPRINYRSTSGGSISKTVPLETVKDSYCAICLGRIQDTTFLNPCNHRFCFDCIQTWSRKKVICPLCKQRFHSFFHTVSTKGAFCEYVLPLSDGSFSYSESRGDHTSSSSHRPLSPADNGILHDEIRGMLTQREKGVYQLMRQFAVTKRPANVDMIALGKFKAQAIIQFRRALYHAGIRVQNVQNPDFHQIASAEFFSRNPNSFDRLIPWLKRELKVLCGNHKSLIHMLQGFILNNMTQHDLQSKEFETLLWPHLHHFTTHFLYEFTSFVQSPLSLKKYDWTALYECPVLPREDSDSFISSQSSDDDHSLLPDNDQTSKANHSLDYSNLGYLPSSSEKVLPANHPNHSHNGRHYLEDSAKKTDTADPDTEKTKQTPDNLITNKLKSSLDTKAQPFESLSYSQTLQCETKNEEMGELHPGQIRRSTITETSTNPPNLLESSDYHVASFNRQDGSSISDKPNVTEKEIPESQSPYLSTRNLRGSLSERQTTLLSPGRKSISRKNGSKSTECHPVERYSPPKNRHGGKNRAKNHHEGKQHTNCSKGKDKRYRRDLRRSKSSDASLMHNPMPPPLKTESSGARDMSKPNSQNLNHSKKLRSKDYAYVKNRLVSEPSWRYIYCRRDGERYRCEEPLWRKGDANKMYNPNPAIKMYNPNPLPSPRERLCLTPENKSSQGYLAKDWCCSERCRSAGRCRGKYSVLEPERGPYDTLGGKSRCKCHYSDAGQARGRARYIQNYMSS